MPSGKAGPAPRMKCRWCRRYPGREGFDAQGRCPLCSQIADLRIKLREAQEKGALAEERGRALLAIKTSVSKGEMRRIAIQAAPAEKEAPDQSNTSN